MPTESSDPESLLAQALEHLSRQWMRTAAGWSDQARQDFEREYVEEFRMGVKRSTHAMRNVTALLKQIRKECSDN
ncbi:MAG TPA: hypothetical protein VEJ63_03220 [Planctomycetota bacterium]|nr:hypothetical protein [Planctomycetota bacterium]